MVKSVNNNPNVMMADKKNDGKEKKGAIMIKNIKNKIVGNNGLVSSLKNKEPLGENHRFMKTQNIV